MVALLRMPDRLPLETWEERRMFPRKETHAEIEGKRIDHSIIAHLQPRLRLAMRDVSLGGLSALADKPLDRGERLSVSIPAQGMSRGWDAIGRVIRCDASSVGYRIAVEFDPLPAA